MFMACVVKPGRISTTVELSAASLAEPEYDDAGTVMSNEEPPYEIVLGTFCGEGRTAALKYGG